MSDPSTAKPAGAGHADHGIMLLAIAAFAASANIRIADTLLPQIAEDFSVSVAAASAVATVYALAYGVFQLIHGPLGDRFGKIRIITIMMLVAGIATGLAALTGDLVALTATRLLCGASSAAVIPLSMAHIGDTVPYERRQEVLARYLSGVVLGIVAGQACGGVLGDLLGWRGVFVSLGAVYAIVTVLLWRKPRPPAPTIDREPLTLAGLLRNLAELRRSAEVRLVVITVFAEGGLFYGAFTYVGAFLRAEYGLDYTTIGILVGTFGLGALLYTILARFIVPLGQRNMALAAGVLLAASFLSLTLNPPAWLLALPILCSGLGFYLIHSTLQTHATQMAPTMRGLAVSVFASFFFLGQSAGAAVDGHLVLGLGYRPVFAATGVLLLCLTFLFASRLERADAGTSVRR